jgi:hypothetical protein
MIRNVKWFVAAHVAAVVALYALALYIGGGWAEPTLPLNGPAPRYAALHSPTPLPAQALRPVQTDLAEVSADRLPRHDLELRSASQDLPAPWAR